MANVYDKKKEEQANKALRKYEIKDKIINAVNPLKIMLTGYRLYRRMYLNL